MPAQPLRHIQDVDTTNLLATLSSSSTSSLTQLGIMAKFRSEIAPYLPGGHQRGVPLQDPVQGVGTEVKTSTRSNAKVAPLPAHGHAGGAS